MVAAKKYRFTRRLGGGGMAEVWLASVSGAEGFSRPVAIKRILAEHSANPEFARLFIKEARISSQLRHPNVVDVLDFDRDEEGRLFLAMELVDGKDLHGLLRAGALPFGVIVHVTSGVLRGLGYAHQVSKPGPDGQPHNLGIVHRDVSPHNVLLSWGGQVKVSDFGIATATAATSQVTNWKEIKGKPTYMSPEQVQGQPLDNRSDLFAVGIMLHEMLTGQPLFEGGQIAEVIARVLAQPIAPPSAIRPEVPADLEAVAMRLLEREAARRYQTAEDALEHLLACTEASNRGPDLLAALLAERFPEDAPRFARPATPRPHERATITGGGPAPGSDWAEPSANASLPYPAPPGQTLALTPTPQAESGPVRRRRALVVGIAAGGSLALAALLAWGLSGSGESAASVAPDAAPPIATPPPAAAVAEDDAAVIATLAELDAGVPAADPDDAPPPDAAPVQTPERATRRPPASRRAEARQTGRVRVAVTPWAEVYVGGELRGYAPTTLELPVGTHTLRLSKPDTGQDERVRIRVRADQPAVIERSW